MSDVGCLADVSRTKLTGGVKIDPTAAWQAEVALWTSMLCFKTQWAAYGGRILKQQVNWLKVPHFAWILREIKPIKFQNILRLFMCTWWSAYSARHANLSPEQYMRDFCNCVFCMCRLHRHIEFCNNQLYHKVATLYAYFGLNARWNLDFFISMLVYNQGRVA